jgi:hypothetical protein
MDMALNDQPAQIEYILEQTGKESLNYFGYSMGTMQFMYAIGMAQEIETLSKTLQKIDRALLLTPCLNGGFFEGSLKKRREDAGEIILLMEDADKLYLWGEGSDRKSDMKWMCFNISDEECEEVKRFYEVGDSVSWKTFLMMSMNDAEDGMLKEFFDDYAVDNNFPEETALIDYTTVINAPQIHTFGTNNDKVCKSKVWF